MGYGSCTAGIKFDVALFSRKNLGACLVNPSFAFPGLGLFFGFHFRLSMGCSVVGDEEFSCTVSNLSCHKPISSITAPLALAGVNVLFSWNMGGGSRNN